MSADNWTTCPRCTKRGLARLEDEKKKVEAIYGVVPVEKYEKFRDELADNQRLFGSRPDSFREDYEIYGADIGEVTVRYAGSCQDCGLTLEFVERYPIPGLEE